MYKMKILKESDGTYLLSDKAKVLDAFYEYNKKHCSKSENDFFTTYIDLDGDLTLSTLKRWINPAKVNNSKSINSDDIELLKSIMCKSKYVSLVTNINSLIYSIEDNPDKERAIEEAKHVSECAKQVIIQEYLDSLEKQKSVA